jgi:hypothetical protein
MGEPAEDTLITAFGDGSLRTNQQGYPKGNNATGITNDVTGATECATIYTELLETGGAPTIRTTGLAAVPTAAELNGEANDFIAYVTEEGVCNFVYAEEAVAAGQTARVITYDSATGVVELDRTSALL